jgi:hypothetical protein
MCCPFSNQIQSQIFDTQTINQHDIEINEIATEIEVINATSNSIFINEQKCRSCGGTDHQRSTSSKCVNNKRALLFNLVDPFIRPPCKCGSTTHQKPTSLLCTQRNIRCRCGSLTHKTTKHHECILNKNNNTIRDTIANNINNSEDLENIQTRYVETIPTEIDTTPIDETNPQYNIARLDVFNESAVTGEYVNKINTKKYFARHVFPKRAAKCENCDGLMWLDERLARSTETKPKFGLCCLEGSIKLPSFEPIPPPILELLTSNNKASKEFRTAIRLYNSILAFTSISCQLDQKLIQATTGTYTYRINGAVHHKISSFLPSSNKNETFSQIYILDALLQSSLRTGMFPLAIKADILNKIQNLLHINNPYVKVYMQAGELWRKDPAKELNIVLRDNFSKDKTFNKPVSNEIAVLMVIDELTTINKRDVVITKRTADDQHQNIFINENLAVNDPLAYPLMHIFGEMGWQYGAYEKILKKTKKSNNLVVNQHLIENPVNHFSTIQPNTTQTLTNEEVGDFLLTENLTSNQPVGSDYIDLDVPENDNNKTKQKYVTANQYYCYRLIERTGNRVK